MQESNYKSQHPCDEDISLRLMKMSLDCHVFLFAVAVRRLSECGSERIAILRSRRGQNKKTVL